MPAGNSAERLYVYDVSFKFHSFTSGIGAEISPNLLKIINDKVAEKLKEKGFTESDEKTMLITGKLIHMDSRFLGSYLVVRVELKDALTGQAIT